MAAFRTFGRIGLLGALLVALAAASLAAPAQALDLGAGDPAPASASAELPCDTDDCTDCGPACAHGCCHGSLVGVTATTASPFAPLAFTTAPAWTHRALAPLAAPAGPDRPPRS